MKRYRTSIIIVCTVVLILFFSGLRKPIVSSKNIPNYINVRYDNQEISTNYQIDDSSIEYMYDVLTSTDVWYISENTAYFFVGDIINDDESISLYSDDFAVQIFSRGVIWDIKNNKRMFISLVNNDEKVNELYKNIFEQIPSL